MKSYSFFRPLSGGTLVGACICAAFLSLPHVLRHTGLWQRIVNLAPSEWFLVSGFSFIVHESAFVIANLVCYLLHFFSLPFFERYKVQPGKYPPPEMVRKALRHVVFTHLCLLLPSSVTLYDLLKRAGLKTDAASIPPWYVAGAQLLIFMIVEDALFYWCHRALHHRSIYGYIHKKHHEFKSTVGIAAEYAHPFEVVFSNLLPSTVGPLLVGPHLVVYWMWVVVRTCESIDGHSGYDFPWSPFRLMPFSGSATFHDYHHSQNVGNYATFFTWWDRMCGTDVSFKNHIAKAQLKPHATNGSSSDNGQQTTGQKQSRPKAN